MILISAKVSILLIRGVNSSVSLYRKSRVYLCLWRRSRQGSGVLHRSSALSGEALFKWNSNRRATNFPNRPGGQVKAINQTSIQNLFNSAIIRKPRTPVPFCQWVPPRGMAGKRGGLDLLFHYFCCVRKPYRISYFHSGPPPALGRQATVLFSPSISGHAPQLAKSN